MKQFEISCSKCGKIKHVRADNFIKTSYEWKSGGGTLICPTCEKKCSVISSRDQTIHNMVLEMFKAAKQRRGHWNGEGDGYADGEIVLDVWYCSECGYCIDNGTDEESMLPNFCPNCGADMRG